MNDELDPEVAAAFAGVKAPNSSASASDIDPEVAAAFRGVTAPGKTARPTSSPPKPRTHEGPVRKAVPAVPRAAERELSWSEAGSGAVKNLLPSAGEAAKGIWDAVTHPKETIGALGDLGKGAVSQAAGALGVKQDVSRKAKDETLIRALEDHYKETYGSVKGFKKALASDPTSILMDASTVVPVVGAGAKAAGLSRTAATLGKIGSAIDPVENALRVAKLPAKAAGKVVPSVQSLTTGKSAKALTVAAEAGKDPQMRKVFKDHMEGRGRPEEINEAATNALNQLSKERGEAYVADMKKHTSGTLPAIPWAPVEKALQSNLDDVTFTDKVSGATRVKHPEAAKALDEIGKEIEWYKALPPGSQGHTLEGFDALKKTIGDIQSGYKNNPVAYQKATSMYNAVLDAIKGTYPDYAQTMKRYADASKEINEIGATFGLSRKSKATSSTVLNRLKRADHDDIKGGLLAELAEKDPRIPYMLAGQELSQFFPGGLRGVMSGSLGTAAAFTHPVAGAASALAASPRAMGSINYAAGNAGRLSEKLADARALRGAYYAGELAEPGMKALPSFAEGEAEGDDTGLTDFDLRNMLGNKKPDADSVWDRMIKQESGGKQFGEDGLTITSPKGALGAAQIMPSTGPEAAALAGEEWSPARLQNDIEYNLKLGRAYFDHQLERFGDPHIAAAAYNAGPTAVERALAKAEKTGQDWLDYLPDETRSYVGVVSRGEFASGGKVSEDLEPHIKRLFDRVKLAKKQAEAHTKPLLGSSDDAVARALKVAGDAI